MKGMIEELPAHENKVGGNGMVWAPVPREAETATAVVGVSMFASNK